MGAVIDDGRVVPRDEDGGDPLEPIAQVLRRLAELEFGVGDDVAALIGDGIPAVDRPPVASAVDHARVGRVEGDRTGLASGGVAIVGEGMQGIRRGPGGDADRRVVLLGRVDAIREGAVGDDVVELRRRLVPVGGPAHPAREGDLRAAIVRDRHEPLVGGVDPEVVHIPVRDGDLGEGDPTVDRAPERGIEHIDHMLLLRVGAHMRVVPGALPQLVLRVGARPGGAAVVTAVQPPRGLRLDDRPDAIGVRPRDGEADLPHDAGG